MTNTIRDHIRLVEAAMGKATLVEATPSPNTAGMTFWHGTDNVAGSKIVRDGFIRTAYEITRKNGGSETLTGQNGVYLTTTFTEALRYATPVRKTAWSWVFAVPGSDIADMTIDEDELGMIAVMIINGVRRFGVGQEEYMRKFHGHYRAAENKRIADAMFGIIRENLPHLVDDLIAPVGVSEIMDAGRRLLPFIPEQLTQKLAEHGCHVVAQHRIVPTMAWRFRPDVAGHIHGESILKSPIAALEQYAERVSTP